MIRAELVRELAQEAGFDIVRFGPADPGEHAAHFERWLELGRHGDMAWLERNRELILDPARWIDRPRSGIALARDYGGPPAALRGGAGRIARYARGRDYHRGLGNRVRKLRDRLEREGLPRGSMKAGTDAVPVLERALAARAGIGFLAKSAGVISPTHGPYLLLSELITPLELPPDDPAAGSCGTCTRCIEACPTDALVAPHQLDARRCLSYTTIEWKGSIPEALRAPQGDWLFGCDICIEVCPFTRFGRAGSDPARNDPADLPDDLRPHRAVETWDLLGVLEIDQAAWDAEWTGTAIRRAGREGLRRNAAVVLGNLGDPAALPALRRCLADPSAVVREHAAWAIGRIDPRDACLDSALRTEPDPAVRDALRRAQDGHDG
jgi:epoxyqueuosine reductase